jgi:L-2,4-diaminobutyrate decarboxylase
MTHLADIRELIEEDCSPSAARAFVELVAEYFAQTAERHGRVSTAHSPAELAARFAEPMPRASRPLEEVVRRFRDEVLPDCNHLFHPRYVGHQVSAPLPAAVWAESLTAALNQSVAVFEMSPVGTVLEHQIVRWLCDVAGYGAQSGGTLTTGGTEATFTAMLAARTAVMPNAWIEGVAGAAGGIPAMICGEHTHYAVTRAAGELGLGMRSVLTIPTRDRRMDPDALRDAVQSLQYAGRPIVAVVATAGSTATGSFDDLSAISEICDEAGVWLHVDGAHGASALLSPAHRHRVRGIERARSIAWDPHKMMLLPLQAGMLLVRDERDLEGAFSQRAPYLFHGGDGERVWDQGVRSFLCSRRADAFKLWIALQRYGADGIGALYDGLCRTTRFMYDAIEASREFEALHEPECNILCFRYVGAHGRTSSQSTARASDDRAPATDALDALNRELRERYNRSGEGWITATDLDGRRVLRVTIMNPRTTETDVTDVLAGLSKIGRALEAGE